MNLEFYAISAICNWDEASIYAITKLKPQHFTEKNQGAYKIATGLFRLNKTVDLGVFESQMMGLGFDSATSSMMYHYALDYDDKWKNNFQELIRQGTYRIISEHTYEIDQMRLGNESIEKISGKATKFASEWVTGLNKTYHSGKEVDELTEEFGAPIKTGYKLYDDEIYKYGGNCKGQMKGVILREKHGKTRSECWEVAQNLRMGHKVLYIAMEGTKKEIVANIKEVLQDEWVKVRNQFFIVDGIRDLEQLEAIVTESVLVEGVGKVVVDYIQLIEPSGRFSGENEKINISTEAFRSLMVRLNFHCVVLSQARKENVNSTVPKNGDGENMMPKGYRFVPGLYDAYGSNAIIKASSMIFIGFRPNRYEELIRTVGLSTKVIDPFGNDATFNSIFMKVAVSRYKSDYVHRWFQFVDTDNGLNLIGAL